MRQTHLLLLSPHLLHHKYTFCTLLLFNNSDDTHREAAQRASHTGRGPRGQSVAHSPRVTSVDTAAGRLSCAETKCHGMLFEVMFQSFTYNLLWKFTKSPVQTNVVPEALMWVFVCGISAELCNSVQGTWRDTRYDNYN